MAKAVQAATGKLQQDMDVLGGFLDECCVFARNAYTPAKDLYSAYCQWAERNGEKPLSQRWFGLRLSERGTCESFKTRTGKSWRGIGLLSSYSETADDTEDDISCSFFDRIFVAREHEFIKSNDRRQDTDDDNQRYHNIHDLIENKILYAFCSSSSFC